MVKGSPKQQHLTQSNREGSHSRPGKLKCILSSIFWTPKRVWSGVKALEEWKIIKLAQLDRASDVIQTVVGSKPAL